MKIHQDINIEESKNENSGTNKSKIKCIKLLILENITLIDRTKVRKQENHMKKKIPQEVI